MLPQWTPPLRRPTRLTKARPQSCISPTSFSLNASSTSFHPISNKAMSAERFRHVVKRTSQLFDRTNQTQEINIDSAIAVLQELKKNATPEELSTLQQVLLASAPEPSPAEQVATPPSYHRRCSAGMPGIATRQPTPRRKSSKDTIETQSPRPRSINVPVCFAKGAGKVAHKYGNSLTSSPNPDLSRSYTPADLECNALGTHKVGTLRVTNGTISPESSMLFDEQDAAVLDLDHLGHSPLGISNVCYSTLHGDTLMTTSNMQANTRSVEIQSDPIPPDTIISETSSSHQLVCPRPIEVQTYPSRLSTIPSEDSSSTLQAAEHVTPSTDQPLQGQSTCIPACRPTMGAKSDSGYDSEITASLRDAARVRDSVLSMDDEPYDTATEHLRQQSILQSLETPRKSAPRKLHKSRPRAMLPAYSKHAAVSSTDDSHSDTTDEPHVNLSRRMSRVPNLMYAEQHSDSTIDKTPITSRKVMGTTEATVIARSQLSGSPQLQKKKSGIFRFIGRSRSKSMTRAEVALPRDIGITVADMVDVQKRSPCVDASPRGVMQRATSRELHLDDDDQSMTLDNTSKDYYGTSSRAKQSRPASRNRAHSSTEPRQSVISQVGRPVSAEGKTRKVRSKSSSPRVDRGSFDWTADEDAPPVPRLPQSAHKHYHQSATTAEEHCSWQSMGAATPRTPAPTSEQLDSPRIVVSQHWNTESPSAYSPKLYLPMDSGSHALQNADAAYTVYTTQPQSVADSACAAPRTHLPLDHSGRTQLGVHEHGSPQLQTDNGMFDRFGGGLGYGWERGRGSQGSAGTREHVSDRSPHKSVALRERFGVDLSDVPVFVARS